MGNPFSIIPHISHNGSPQQSVGCKADLKGNFPPVANDEKLAGFAQAAEAGYVLGARREEAKEFFPRGTWLKRGYLLNPEFFVRGGGPFLSGTP
ncbi:MAG: hypothetical protein LUO89_04310 [Methanothrix sp.]|nr:hypothetical protein [Methanothrix sp.]